ncbi:hypothetical protein RB195_021235 [Necator americanus]|uniref:Activin types I and II receptor domain protein n=1 Tax=Necator americanus TaxID=51031 RepID=A0ABR1E9Z9_NECAM
MRRLVFPILLFTYFAYFVAAKNNGRKLLTCVKCLGNDTACQDICPGYFCYKSEIHGHSMKLVKRGCLNNTDPLSRVNECTLRENHVGGLIITENFCICTSDRCNLSSVHYAALIYLFVALISGLS